MSKINEQWINQLPIENIKTFTPVAGGDVNDAYQVETNNETYFLLVQPNRSVEFYTNEIEGLKDLAKANITVPEVHSSGEINGDAYLLLSFLKKGVGSQSDLGKMVAQMHLEHNKKGTFGYPYHHESGDISFNNEWTESWKDLFVDRRLDHLRDQLDRTNLWSKENDEQYQLVRKIIIQELNRHESAPSLLHGDLWGGNYMFLSDGRPALYDPSTFYGDREFDLGITTVFGGFDQDFYEAYEQAYPLEEGSNYRLNFYRLYFLLLHLYKFGRIYSQSVERTMEEIISNND